MTERPRHSGGAGWSDPDANATSPTHEYAEDDYDPAADGPVAAASARVLERDQERGATDEPRRTNVKRIVIGIAGLVGSLLLLNIGLNILSEPPEQTPATSIPARPRSSTTAAPGTPGSAPAGSITTVTSPP